MDEHLALLDSIDVPDSWILEKEIIETGTFCPDTSCPYVARIYRAELTLDETTDALLIGFFFDDTRLEIVDQDRCDVQLGCRVVAESSEFQVRAAAESLPSGAGGRDDGLPRYRASINVVRVDDIKGRS